MNHDIKKEKFIFFNTFKKNVKEPVVEVVKEIVVEDKPKMNIKFSTVWGWFMFGLIVFMITAIYNEFSQEKEIQKNIVHAFNSLELETQLKVLDKDLIVKNKNNIMTYSLKMPVKKAFGLMEPFVLHFEIQKENTSKTFIWNDLSSDRVDSKIYSLKESFKNINVTEIKRVPDLKTGNFGVSFKVEDNQ